MVLQDDNETPLLNQTTPVSTVIPLIASTLEQVKLDSGARYAAFDLVNVFSLTLRRQKAQKQLPFT